jgi:hypothetical protein
LLLLQIKVVRMGFLWRVVDGYESSGAADDFGRGDDNTRTRRAALIGASVVGIGAGDVGALVGHGALAIAAAVGLRLAVIVGAGNAGDAGGGAWGGAWVQLLAIPLLWIESRGGRG